MTELIVCLTTKTGMAHIKDLIEKNEWEKVVVICTEKIAIDTDFSGDLLMVVIDNSKRTSDLINDLVTKLNKNISGFEVALNLFSGSGKDHMAIISAILKIGVGFRLVMQGAQGVKEL